MHDYIWGLMNTGVSERSLHSAAFFAAPNPQIIVALRGEPAVRCIDANAAARDLGLVVVTANGKLLLPSDVAAVIRSGRDALADGHATPWRGRLVLADGPADVSGCLIALDTDGVPARALCTVDRVTDSADDASGLADDPRLRSANAALSERNVELTHDNDLLRRLNAEIHRSNRDLEQFAHVASHDLAEPLRMVSSFVELLHRRYSGQLDERADRYIALAMDGAARMTTLIDNLLAFARVRAVPLATARVNLNTVLDDVRDDLGEQLRSSRGTVTVSDALPTVDGDATQLRQVLQNLISNAIKFHGEQPPRITVSAAARDDGWSISVSDQGIGVPEGQESRAFDMFTRLHPGQEHPGTGVGLAICQRIVERHGGQMTMQPSPGGGTAVSFTLAGAPARRQDTT